MKRSSYLFIKRSFDIIFGIIGCIILIPLSILVKLAFIITGDFGPIFFTQKRIGKNGKPFTLIKYRSMSIDNNIKDHTKDDQLTKIGKIIRATSIDELPQFINVFIGDMSLVGPRPWISAYYDRMNDEQRQRNSIRPGLTGLAQARGRNTLSIQHKIAYDLAYIKDISFINDLKIILLTVASVSNKDSSTLGKYGIYSELKELENQVSKAK